MCATVRVERVEQSEHPEQSNSFEQSEQLQTVSNSGSRFSPLYQLPFLVFQSDYLAFFLESKKRMPDTRE